MLKSMLKSEGASTMKNYYKILREAKAECAACGIWLGEVADIGICHKNLKRWGR